MEKLKHASVRIPLSSGRYNILGPCLIKTRYDRTCADVKCFCITPTFVWSQDHKIAQSIFEHVRMLSRQRSWILLIIVVKTFTFFAHPKKILLHSRSITKPLVLVAQSLVLSLLVQEKLNQPHQLQWNLCNPHLVNNLLTPLLSS